MREGVLSTTVYFATNRVVTNASDPNGGYTSIIVPPLKPQEITYGTAIVEGIDVATNAQGFVSEIKDTKQGGFSAQAIVTLVNPGTDLLVFIHGFDNTFSDAISRAAFNREWLAASGLPGTNTTVVAFSWPSSGRVVGYPVPAASYLADQNMARSSGMALMSFMANLESIIGAARARGSRVTLLAHSMGNLALEAGVVNWFLHGKGEAILFNLTDLAAGDVRYDTFDLPSPAGLSGLVQLSERVEIYFSRADQVLQLSMVVNLGAKRLGQDGPHNRADPNAFPPDQFSMVDCTDIRDYEFNFMTSHQYYRMSPQVRSIMAAGMAGPVVA
jgi:esterase/lipase superfamily enzyme